MDKKTIELAIDLHGHLAPGIALGLRMCELVLSRLEKTRGDKHLIGISETVRCLADAMQAAAGCTLGHGNAFVEDYGKLALTIGDVRTGRGVRVALKEEAKDLSHLMHAWMMRLRKLTHREEDALSKRLLEMDEKYLALQDVYLYKDQHVEKSRIVKCDNCGELIPQSLTVITSDGCSCRPCNGQLYYKIV